MSDLRPYIGCAGWSLWADYAAQFPESGTHLERYAARFSAVEINSSFYRPHQPKTYERWAASVPENFRFAVKVPKTITHEQRLCDMTPLLERFLHEVAALGPKLGPLLIQLPPSLAHSPEVSDTFFQILRARFKGPVVCEPRHPTWFTPEVDQQFAEYKIARVAADPAPVAGAETPGGWNGLVYYRLHGSPRIYYSAYSREYLNALAHALTSLTRRSIPAWCIFDNTAEGAATGNALDLLQQL